MKNVRFARGLSALSGGFDPNYSEAEPEPEPLPGPLYLITNDEREQPMQNVAMLANVDSQGKFEVVLHAGNNLTGVEYVTFRVGEGNAIRSTRTDRVLTLLTPVHFELKLSGCDGATEAVVYDLNGRQQAKATVSNGATTISVAHMPAGIYIVKVGNKSLKFTKE